MRLFVALELPPEVQDDFADLIRELRLLLPEMRWAPVKNIHLTLKFLGETPEESVSSICSVLENVAQSEAVRIRAAGLGAFDGRGTGGVVFAKITESAQLVQLSSGISTQLQTLGINAETRPFIPHLTLGRSKTGRLPKNLDRVLAQFAQQEFANLQYHKFYLFESKLKPTGAEYTILQSFSFVTEPQN